MSLRSAFLASLLILQLAALGVGPAARAQEELEDDIAIQPVRGDRRIRVAAPEPSVPPSPSPARKTTAAPASAGQRSVASTPPAPAAPASAASVPAAAAAAAARAMNVSKINLPCASGESWTFNPPRADTAAFTGYLSSPSDPLAALAAAHKLKDDLGRYWKARVLFDQKLNFLSHQLFTELFRTSSDPKIRQAALVCLVKARNRMPSLELPKAEAWKPYFIQDPEALLTLLMQELPAQNTGTLTLAQPHVHFLKALQAHARRWAPDEVRFLRSFIEQRGRDPYLARFAEDARLMLARALYANGQYAESLAEYRAIDKSSNTQVDVLNEMAWPMLQANKLPQTVGLMQQLRIGALKPVFAPEPYLAAAIATLKLCLYPEMSAVVATFKQDYRVAFDWLSRNQNHENLYVEVIQSLGGRSKVPPKVSLEWVRSATFLTRQSDINQLAKEEKQLKDLANKPAAAGPVIAELRARFDRDVGALRGRLVADISRDLNAKNRQMLESLKSVHRHLAELETRIYLQSATDKMALVAPHKEDLKTEEALAERRKNLEKNPEEVWSWGRLPASDAGDAEIWEDEVGTSFRIHLVDKCKNQGKFLNAPNKKR